MTVSNHISMMRLRDRAMFAGADTEALELALYCLGEIGDGDFGLASQEALTVIDEIERRVVEAEAKRTKLRVVE